METGSFYVILAEMLYKKEKSQWKAKFCTGGCEERTRAREVEEFPLLKDVAMERLMKTQQDGKILSGSCGDFEL
jgi:hypothetical protein